MLLSSPPRNTTASSPHAFIVPKLRIAVSLSALFDLSAANALNRIQGKKKYLEYMSASKDLPFKPGPAFPFVSKLMRLNDSGKHLVSLTVLSGASREETDRLTVSLAKHGLVATPSQKKALKNCCGVRANELGDHPIKPFDLILSTRIKEVMEASAYGLPAGYVDPSHIPQNGAKGPLHLAFDFDRCAAIALSSPDSPDFLVDSEAFTDLHTTGPGDIQGQALVSEREARLVTVPAQPGPVATLFHKLSELREIAEQDPRLPNIALSLVTARTNGCFDRVITTLSAWGIKLDHIKSTGWNSKGAVLKKMGVDCFLDDATHHVKDVLQKNPETLAVHLPWCPQHLDRIAALYDQNPIKTPGTKHANRPESRASLPAFG